MTSPLIVYAFTAGELAPTLWNRTDFEKYDLAVAEAENFFVDYRGGISTRPGLIFREFIKDDDKPVKLFDFAFADDDENVNLLVFGENYVRFVEAGSYLLEGDQTIISATQANPCVLGITGHPYSVDDWISVANVAGMTELNGRTYRISATTTNTVTLQELPYATDLDATGFSAYTSGGVANRVYTLATPYTAAQLAELRAYNRADYVRLTHPDFPVKNLVRASAISWSISDETFGSGMAAPANVAVNAGAGTAGVAFGVTAVDKDGNESTIDDVILDDTAVQYNTTAGDATVTWDAVTGAVYYNVYRSNITRQGADINKGWQLGYLGKAFGTEFTDDNITPDFTIAPPVNRDPFAEGAILSINVTAGGSGYNKSTTTVSVSGGGSGFKGVAIVDNGGAVIGVRILDPGSGYSSPTVSFSGGSGATATATARSATGINPHVSTIFQQSQIYGATDEQPLTFWKSRPKLLSNFDEGEVITDADPIEAELDSDRFVPIRHLIPTRSGLLIGVSNGIYQLKSDNGSAVTPLNSVSDPESFTGMSKVPPLRVDTDIVYIENEGTTVRLLTYTDYTKVYSGTDMSILSNHLITPHQRISAWDYEEEPFKIVKAVRSDGILLQLTIVPEQNVFAWTRGTTKGLFKNIKSIRANEHDTTYCVVERYINGRWTKFLEEFADREPPIRGKVKVDEFFAVDCGLSTADNLPAATLTPAAASGTGVTFNASASVFAPGDVGKVIRVGGGRAEITAYVSGTQVTVDIIEDIKLLVPQDPSNMPVPAASGEWSMNAKITNVTGLWHLEGESVACLADGNVVENLTVSGGQVTLPAAASKIHIGLAYTCTARTLPLTAQNIVIEGKRKRVVDIAVRVNETRGLETGSELDKMYEMKDRTTEGYGVPTQLRSDLSVQLVAATFNQDGQTYFRQTYPLPATILGFVTNVDIGDDDN